jgi:hypothetical protein
VLDEAHHMLPETWGHTGAALPRWVSETIIVTVHPGHLVFGRTFCRNTHVRSSTSS